MFTSNTTKTIYISLIAILLLCMSWGFFIEPNMLLVNRVNLKIPNWPESRRGYKILFIGDLHTGSPFNHENKVKSLVKLANKENVDIVLSAGDYVICRVVEGKFIPTKITAKILSEIKSKQGFITVLGNHDWWKDGFRTKKELEENGFIVLENEAVNIANKNEKPIWITGLADNNERIVDIKKTLKQVKPEEPVIMLTHEPDIFPQLPNLVSLTLAGHTHGGQIRLPFIGGIFTASIYGNKYAKGYIAENSKQMFVTSGIGTSILPVRFLCPPEIVVLTLNSK
jgi:uncharacterized protein